MMAFLAQTQLGGAHNACITPAHFARCWLFTPDVVTSNPRWSKMQSSECTLPVLPPEAFSYEMRIGLLSMS